MQNYVSIQQPVEHWSSLHWCWREHTFTRVNGERHGV